MKIVKYNYEQICSDLVNTLIDMCFEKEEGLTLYGSKDYWLKYFKKLQELEGSDNNVED